jgi:hypothetical protein
MSLKTAAQSTREDECALPSLVQEQLAMMRQAYLRVQEGKTEDALTLAIDMRDADLIEVIVDYDAKRCVDGQHVCHGGLPSGDLVARAAATGNEVIYGLIKRTRFFGYSFRAPILDKEQIEKMAVLMKKYGLCGSVWQMCYSHKVFLAAARGGDFSIFLDVLRQHCLSLPYGIQEAAKEGGNIQIQALVEEILRLGNRFM